MLARLIDELIHPEVGHDEVAIAEGGALGLTGQGDQLTHLMHVGDDVTDVEFHALFGEELEGLDAPGATGLGVEDG